MSTMAGKGEQHEVVRPNEENLGPPWMIIERIEDGKYRSIRVVGLVPSGLAGRRVVGSQGGMANEVTRGDALEWNVAPSRVGAIADGEIDRIGFPLVSSSDLEIDPGFVGIPAIPSQQTEHECEGDRAISNSDALDLEWDLQSGRYRR